MRNTTPQVQNVPVRTPEGAKIREAIRRQLPALPDIDSAAMERRLIALPDRFTRAYRNGSQMPITYATLVRQYADIATWLTFNRMYRFGCALFIDGVCLYDGNDVATYFSAQALAALVQAEQAALAGPPRFCGLAWNPVGWMYEVCL